MAEFIRLQSLTGEYTLIGQRRLNAQGVIIECPCGQEERLLWFVGVPKDILPPGRWTPNGTNMDDLTLNPSILTKCAHFFIKNGQIIYC